VPAKSIGLAGPFIGDDQFTNAYQEPFKALVGDDWWQVRTLSHPPSAEDHFNFGDQASGREGWRFYRCGIADRGDDGGDDRRALRCCWVGQVETVDQWNSQNFDGTVEGYNIGEA
jgi:hypothetical protein